MRGVSDSFNLLKSTRLERALIPLSFIFLTANVAGRINFNVYILSLCCVLLYVSGGILNAKIDGDLKLKHCNHLVVILSVFTIMISFYDKIIFFSVLSWVFLNIVYSKYSRKILFGDSFILSITHAIIPIISVSFLLGLDFFNMFKISGFSFLLVSLIIPMKNFKGIVEDKKNRYKTLLTYSKDGRFATVIIFNLSFLLLILAPIIFGLDKNYYLILILILILYFVINYFILNKREIFAYKLARLDVLLINLAISVSVFTNFSVFLISTFLIVFYLFYLFIF